MCATTKVMCAEGLVQLLLVYQDPSMHIVPQLQLHVFACHRWKEDSKPVMPCHEGDQPVDLHLFSYSTLLHVPVLAAKHVVQHHLHEMDQLEELLLGP